VPLLINEMLAAIIKKEVRKMVVSKPALSAGSTKISISKTLLNRGITEEKILELETKGLLRKHGIKKCEKGRYIEYFWYKNSGQ
jgi:malic enzyme